MHISCRIKKVRNQKQMTRKELANGIVSYSYLRNIENKNVESSEETLILLAKRLDFPSYYFERSNIKDHVLQYYLDSAVLSLRNSELASAIRIVLDVEHTYPYIQNVVQEIQFFLLQTAISFQNDQYYFGMQYFEEELLPLCDDQDISHFHQDIQDLYYISKIITFLCQDNKTSHLQLPSMIYAQGEISFYLALYNKKHFKYMEAIQNAQYAYTHFKRKNCYKSQYQCLHLLGALYWDILDFTNSEYYLKQAREMAEQDNNQLMLTYITLNMGLIDYVENRPTHLFESMIQAIDIRNTLGSRDLTNAYILVMEMLLKEGKGTSLMMEELFTKAITNASDDISHLILELISTKIDLQKGKKSNYELRSIHLISNAKKYHCLYNIAPYIYDFGQYLKYERKYKDACSYLELAFLNNPVLPHLFKRHFLGRADTPYCLYI